MIDNLEKTNVLLEKLKRSLPIEAKLSHNLLRTLTETSPDLSIRATCNVTKVFYAGDEGGVLCYLDFGGPELKTVQIVSITHLGFDRHIPLAREIEAYQRHRIKKLKQQQGRGS